MLNNGGPPQNDAYSGMQGIQQYGQNMTSTLNAPPAGYGGQQKRTAMQPGLGQPGMQPSMAGVRQPARGQGIARFTGSQFPANRSAQHQAGLSSPSVASSITPMRQGQSQYATHAGGPQSSALAYGGHQAQASQQQHATPQQHPAARVNPERRASVFDVPYGQSGIAPAPQGAGAQQARDAGFTRFNRPAAVISAAGAHKGLGARSDAANGKEEGLLDANEFPMLGGGGGAPPGPQDLAAGLSSMRLAAAGASAAKKLDGMEFPTSSGAPGLGAPPSNGLTGLPPPRQPGRPPAQQAGDLAAQAAFAAHLRQRAAEEDSGDDKYRLLDLLPLCPGHRRRDDWNDRQFLSVGIDVESLGLDLCQPDNVYPMLASPWTTGGSAGQLDFELPKCYLFEAPTLSYRALEQIGTETLLFIFYAFAGEVRQVSAAVELEKRHCFWHKALHQWWRKQDIEACTTATGVPAIRGKFTAWDAAAWRWVVHENMIVERQVAEPVMEGALDVPSVS